MPVPPKRPSEQPSHNMPWARLVAREHLDDFGERMLTCLRLVASMKTNTHCVAGRLVEQLGDAPTVRRFMLVAHAIASVWPEPVSVCPPCCGVVTHDEYLVIQLFALTTNNDRPAFDEIARDFLGDAERAHLYVSMQHFLILHQAPMSL